MYQQIQLLYIVIIAFIVIGTCIIIGHNRYDSGILCLFDGLQHAVTITVIGRFATVMYTFIT